MKLFIVIGGIKYEGEVSDSIKWFTSKKEAIEYGKTLVKYRNFDYYELLEGEEGKLLD